MHQEHCLTVKGSHSAYLSREAPVTLELWLQSSCFKCICGLACMPGTGAGMRMTRVRATQPAHSCTAENRQIGPWPITPQCWLPCTQHTDEKEMHNMTKCVNTLLMKWRWNERNEWNKKSLIADVCQVCSEEYAILSCRLNIQWVESRGSLLFQSNPAAVHNNTPFIFWLVYYT